MENASRPLAVDVTWTIEDARAYARIVIAAQLPLMARPESWLWRRAAAIAGACVASAVVFVATTSPLWAMAGAAMGYLLVVAGMWANHLNNSRGDGIDGLFRNDPRVYEPRRFEIRDASFLELREGLRREVEWRRVDRLAREAGLIIVWLAKIDGMPIPERCFADAGEADAFHAELQARIAAAKPGG